MSAIDNAKVWASIKVDTDNVEDLQEIVRDGDGYIKLLLAEIEKRDAVIEAAKDCIKTYSAGNRVSWDEALKALEE